MARAVVATGFGGPEVLAIVEEEPRSPRADEVRLTVRAVGINPIDWKLYSGAMGTEAQLPMRLGYEAAGVVAQAGADARGPAGPLSGGDEVIAFRISGAYAEEVVVSASTLVPKPESMSWEEAGGLMLAGTTAVHALTATEVDAGDTVLIHGAAGGVGLMALQVAVARGARVIATASERNHELLRGLGAAPTTYGGGHLSARVRELAPDGVDVAVDCVGSDEAIDVSLELISDRSRIVSIAAFSRGSDGIKLIGGGPGADPGTDVRDAARMQLVDLVRDGGLTFPVRSFSLDDAAAAHREGQAGHTVGKLVLVP